MRWRKLASSVRKLPAGSDTAIGILADGGAGGRLLGSTEVEADRTNPLRWGLAGAAARAALVRWVATAMD